MRRLKTAYVRSERRGYLSFMGFELIDWNPAAMSSTNIPSGQRIQLDGTYTSSSTSSGTGSTGEGIEIGEEMVIEEERTGIGLEVTDVDEWEGVFGGDSRARCERG